MSGRAIRKTVGALPALALSAAAGILAWSRFGVDHDMAAVPSLPSADRYDVDDGSGGSVAVYHDESGEGTPVLLVHSVNAAASAYEMKPLFERLVSIRPVHALDLPGYGMATRGDRPYTPHLMSAAITATLERIGEPTHLVALSLSAEFAAQAAVLSPDRVASLALISPTGFGGVVRSESQGGAALRFPLWSQALFDLIASRRSIEYFLSKSFNAAVDSGLVVHAYRTSHRPGARFAPLAFLSGELFSRDAVEAIYRHVRVPSLVLYDRDPFTEFVELPEFLTDHPDHWDAVRIAGTFGLPHWDQPVPTLAALESHWASRDAKVDVPAFD
jgi:pimeloyl-ACP methyl ester carboxylesterase